MALNQNQFAMTTLKGTLDSSGASASLSVEFYSASPSAVLTAGEFVLVSSTPNPGVTRVSQGSAITDKFAGMILTNPLKDAWAVGEMAEMALAGSIAMAEASAAITAGALVQYDPATKKCATKASGSQVGVAMENASGDGSLFRILIQPA